MRRRSAFWLVCLLTAALPLQAAAGFARMACGSSGAEAAAAAGHVGQAVIASVHDLASHEAVAQDAAPEDDRSGDHPSRGDGSHDTGAHGSACAACCVATAPPSAPVTLAAVPAPSSIAFEPVLPRPARRAERLERPPRTALA